MSDGAEYIRYVTERLLRHWEQPEPREAKLERRRRREPWADRWFGHVAAAGFRMWLGDLRKSVRTRQREAGTSAGGMPDYS